MSNLAYEGDKTTHGGVILTGSDRITVKGRRAARQGDLVSCPIHGENRILGGTTRMTDGGVPLARDGDVTECGSVLIATTTGATVR
ncbi:PAAR domain-containing protein [Cupriavidus sp. BIS7]|uniref:PAAR domain-containing protein n=1 Tax=Cupriavidus sp. BIS7 TaxID=1217718 RepID=UPI0002D97066|nr:PAAR domain-containing protein [Cupriavidus sp. BIS7]